MGLEHWYKPSEKGEHSVELSVSHAGKNKIHLYFNAGKDGLIPALLCAVEEGIRRHYALKAPEIVMDDKTVKMSFYRPPSLPPGTLADCARAILLLTRSHDGTISCSGCTKKKQYCTLVRV